VPETHGLDLFFGYYDQVHAHTYYPTYLIRNSQEVPLPGNPGSYHEGKTFSQYVIHDEAKKFIRANKDHPFFLYLPYTPPHGRWGFPDDDPSLAPYKDKPWSRDAKVYAAMVNLIDREVGEILALLKELGLEENTIVFFSGDNGGHEYFADKDHPHGFFGPNVDPATGKRVFRGGKGWLYEGGLRIPFIVRWPGKIKPGRVSDHLGYFPDIMPTLAELCGAPCPKDTDGISIVPELLGGREQPQHDYLYWEDCGQIAVREGNWKAVRTRSRRGKPGKWELYDLAADLAETTDLADRAKSTTATSSSRTATSPSARPSPPSRGARPRRGPSRSMTSFPVAGVSRASKGIASAGGLSRRNLAEHPEEKQVGQALQPETMEETRAWS